MERHNVPNKIRPSPSDPYQSFAQQSKKISIRSNRKEIPLDFITGASLRTTSTPSHTTSNVKWKRAVREKDQNKDPKGRDSNAKAGHPSSNRGEGRTKAKSKLKIGQPSSANGIGWVAETTNFRSPSSQESFDTANNSTPRMDQEVELQSPSDKMRDPSKEMNDGVFTNLPLPGIDSIVELDVGLDGQSPQDIASWLNVEDDGLQDNDLMGLEISLNF